MKDPLRQEAKRAVRSMFKDMFYNSPNEPTQDQYKLAIDMKWRSLKRRR